MPKLNLGHEFYAIVQNFPPPPYYFNSISECSNGHKHDDYEKVGKSHHKHHKSHGKHRGHKSQHNKGTLIHKLSKKIKKKLCFIEIREVGDIGWLLYYSQKFEKFSYSLAK